MIVKGVFWSDNHELNDHFWIEKAKATLDNYWDNHIISLYDETRRLTQSCVDQHEVALAIEQYRLVGDYFVTTVVFQVTHAYLNDGAMLGSYFNQFINHYTKHACSIINDDLDELIRLLPSICL